MARFLKNNQKQIGQAPGAPIFIGNRKTDEIEVTIMDYDREDLFETTLLNLDDIKKYKEKESVTWINIYGLHDTVLIEEVAKVFELHPLTLESLLNTGSRPNMEDHDSYLQFNIKMMSFKASSKEIESEQLTLVLSDKFILTFQERPGDNFEPIRQRIRKNKGRVRKMSTDFLAYLLLETTVENYLVILSRLGELIEDTEEKIIEEPSKDLLFQIFNFKKEMNYLSKTIRPVRDFFVRFNRLESSIVSDSALPFLKDLLELSTQAVEVVDVYREMLSDQVSLYDSRINSKLNEIMKVLTIFSVVFIPLTFIAGIYGTNFEYIPELKYKYGYFIFWVVLIITAVTMLTIFRKKKWI